ncbi:hypothetical protein QJS04_geneDACA013496 [Acorus gramineus]|uniref:AB hydrolase-1 domain-containing protein n=1 Tax=Acorus gramineus TaxID=55184 RepID=A0AAV9AJ37_ACOGR|nr:hypothetical protein QJS04_geneDACA013496 [Acorus gramineus]
MGKFRVSLVSLYGSYLLRSFKSAGLQSQTIPLGDDHGTVVHMWAPPSSKSSSSSSKPALVLLHGFGPPAAWQWQTQVGPLSTHFDLYLPDLIFFGGSDTGPSGPRTVEFQAQSVVRALDRAGVERFSVAGTSYGGFVAYHVARACGERVEGVVIASSDVGRGKEDDEELLRKAGVDSIHELMLPTSVKTLRTLGALCVYRTARFVPDFLWRDLIQTLIVPNREKKVELLEALKWGKQSPDITPLPQEVLIVWGEHDRIFPLEKAHVLQKKLGERTRLEVIKKSAHVPQIEDPRIFNTTVKDFLLNLPKSSI